MGAGARAGAGSYLSPKHREQSSLCGNGADLVQNRLQCAEFRTRSATKTLFHLERVLVSSKLKISVKSQSESPSVSRGPTRGPWGWTKNQKTNEVFNGSKAILSIFSDFLELKPFLCRITVGAKKIGQWPNAGNQLLQTFGMGAGWDLLVIQASRACALRLEERIMWCSINQPMPD